MSCVLNDDFMPRLYIKGTVWAPTVGPIFCIMKCFTPYSVSKKALMLSCISLSMPEEIARVWDVNLFFAHKLMGALKGYINKVL